jgi:hypothetical protein
MTNPKTKFAVSGVGLLTLAVILAAICFAAEDSVKKSTDVPATVIAHLPLPQSTGAQMFLQRDAGKSYLYVQQATKQGFMIVDVSKPDMPRLLKHSAEVSQATAGNLEMVGPDVAIASAPEKKPTTLTSTSHPAQTVRILDLSNPAKPQVLEEFNGVTGVLPDGNHGLIYLTNNEGLWVLKYDRGPGFEPTKRKKPCTSESEIQAMPPDCG